MLQNSVRHLRRGRLSCDEIALTHKQTEDVASEEVEVSTSQHKVKKGGGQFCVAGGPYGTRCKNSAYSHGVSMHTFPANQTTNLSWTNFLRMHRLDFRPCKTSSFPSRHFEISCFVDRYGDFRG